MIRYDTICQQFIMPRAVTQEFKGDSDKDKGGPITAYLRKFNPCPEHPDPRGREIAAAVMGSVPR